MNTMLSKTVAALGLTIAATLAVPSAALAGCSINSLRGPGALYAMASDGSTYACDISVWRSGAVHGDCEVRAPGSPMAVELEIGPDSKLEVSRACRVRGVLSVDGCAVEINHAWIANDKQSMEGVAQACDGTTLKFSAVGKPWNRRGGHERDDD
ncbi:MAG: hypothetical protein H6983_20725 [Ectothiorhodospiraceae bacterium]|nr:hypothetical protein [Ectothiorhodospiraceae bacterium]